MPSDLVPRSLVWATSIDVLGPDRIVERRADHLVIRSPSNPDHYWGNFLVFDDAPRSGDLARWERAFADAFADELRIRHRTFAWDRVDGQFGEARTELEANGYAIDETVGLVAEPADLRSHTRENRDVAIAALDPFGDEKLWDAVVELNVETREPEHDEDGYRTFSRARQRELRELFRAGNGTWYVALDQTEGRVVAGCGIVVTAGRGRYQSVVTASAYRRRGICSRLVVEAARLSSAAFGTDHFVIAAEIGYHALGLYESLGFRRRERVAGALLMPAQRS
jgi:ribosomal protein S18 acetylase RimI-like enzyme